mmetsp:Transcript_5255/g.12504  ORF Transcript_5255/g.12504 Transcript_5255/m.12504 type:complete len:208 (+) Transcript_5255:561-1184(+)
MCPSSRPLRDDFRGRGRRYYGPWWAISTKCATNTTHPTRTSTMFVSFACRRPKSLRCSRCRRPSWSRLRTETRPEIHFLAPRFRHQQGGPASLRVHRNKTIPQPSPLPRPMTRSTSRGRPWSIGRRPSTSMWQLPSRKSMLMALSILNARHGLNARRSGRRGTFPRWHREQRLRSVAEGPRFWPPREEVRDKCLRRNRRRAVARRES